MLTRYLWDSILQCHRLLLYKKTILFCKLCCFRKRHRIRGPIWKIVCWRLVLSLSWYTFPWVLFKLHVHDLWYSFWPFFKSESRFRQSLIKWKKEWASSHTPRSNIAWECCIQQMAIPSISDGQSDRKPVSSELQKIILAIVHKG